MPTPTQADDVLAAYRRAREAGDVDLALSLYRDDAELREDPFEPALAGDLAIRARWNEMAATRAHVEFDVERSWTAGSTVLAAWHGAHTVRRTGQRVRQRGFVTFELDPEGLILRERGWTLERIVGVDGTFRPEPPEDDWSAAGSDPPGGA